MKTVFLLFAILLVAQSEELTRVALTVIDNDDGTRAVHIVNPEYPGNTWWFRCPEYVVVGPGSGRDTRIREVAKVGGGVLLRGTRENRNEAAFEVRLLPLESAVDIEASLTNTGSDDWTDSAFGLACLVFGSCPAFFDSSQTQTFVHVDGDFVPVRELVENDTWRRDKRHSGRVLREADRNWTGKAAHQERLDERLPDAALIVRVSRDGKSFVALAWEDAFSVTFNLADAKLNCIHSNPRFGRLAAKETKTVRGRIYFGHGTAQDAYDRFARDFPSLGFGDGGTTR